jgi:hypothetical protein
METHEKEALKFNIQGLTILTPYDVYNMLVSALEGGSNYWYWFGDKTMDRVFAATEDMKGEPTVDRILMAVQRGALVNVFDCESMEKLGTLTPESWAKAEMLMLKNHRSHFADILKENDDATTADIYFQYAVMGNLIYG